MTSSTKPLILIVEDDSSTLAALERLFRNHFSVLTAENVDVAQKQILAYKNIAVVMSDYHLPGTSGLEFLSKLNSDHPTMIKIVLTGVLDSEELIRALSQGLLHRIFRKPWENDFLLLQMTEAIQQHQLLVERYRFPIN